MHLATFGTYIGKPILGLSQGLNKIESWVAKATSWRASQAPYESIPELTTLSTASIDFFHVF